MPESAPAPFGLDPLQAALLLAGLRPSFESQLHDVLWRRIGLFDCHLNRIADIGYGSIIFVTFAEANRYILSPTELALLNNQAVGLAFGFQDLRVTCARHVNAWQLGLSLDLQKLQRTGIYALEVERPQRANMTGPIM